MKKALTGHPFYMILIYSSLIASCGNKMAETTTTTDQHMKATTQTIDNMQSAYKGEMTATAKYEAFSKKAQEEGLHSIAVLYNAVSVAESIHARNHKAVIEDAGATGRLNILYVPTVEIRIRMPQNIMTFH